MTHELTPGEHHRSAERILGRDFADTDALLRAIAHALLANTRPALDYDAYNPRDTTK